MKYREDPIILDPRNKNLGARLIINLEKLYLSLKKLDLKDSKIENYSIFNLKFLSQINFSKTKFNAFISFNNILNKKYYDNIRINAFGSRYYEPAPGFNIMFGIRK